MPVINYFCFGDKLVNININLSLINPDHKIYLRPIKTIINENEI